ncbi:MBL fold metallo-hydrolase [Govanella unica]|uniref:MBL fold metallo-hydrolase n=1 Tax=Govanella unica TaxID=2975056 RepID=A0A9X3Z7C3_9PROT|nr:MBL fold metallo-hydrolase [Govania unica]MDA5194026.1 MBL fold metallo-hydrolase [Govania unica]
MLAVADGVYWIRMPLPLALDHINLWALEEADGWTLVDSGMNSSQTQGHWESLITGPMAGKPIKRLIVTHLHPDHFGLAGWFSARWHVPVYMTQSEFLMGSVLSLGRWDELPWAMELFFHRAGLTPDEIANLKTLGYGHFADSVYRPPGGYHRLRDGDSLDIGGREWRIVVGRGHSPEHACLHCPDLGLLIAGDQVLPRISSNVSVYSTEPEANPLKDWLDSLTKLRGLPADTHVLPAHGYLFTGLHDRLDALTLEHETKLVELAEACGEPMSAVDALPVMFLRDLKGFTRLMALGETIAHFHLLLDRGLVIAEDGQDGVRRFRRT